MKFQHKLVTFVTISTIAYIGNINQAQATNCDQTRSITVPWSWTLTQTGSSYTTVNAENTGASFSSVPDSNTFGGAFTVTRNFTPPSFYCSQQGNAPTSITLKMDGSFTGYLATDFIPVPGIPALEGPFAGATASINVLSSFNNEQLFIGTKEINQKRSTTQSVGDGSTITFSGNLDAFAYKGLTVGTLGYSLASAQLGLTSSLIGTRSGTVTYLVPVPEPVTILGLITALGFGIGLKRRYCQ